MRNNLDTYLTLLSTFIVTICLLNVSIAVPWRKRKGLQQTLQFQSKAGVYAVDNLVVFINICFQTNYLDRFLPYRCTNKACKHIITKHGKQPCNHATPAAAAGVYHGIRGSHQRIMASLLALACTTLYWGIGYPLNKTRISWFACCGWLVYGWCLLGWFRFQR